jgi:hypothetical protein
MLISITCSKCSHSGLVTKETLPRILVCSRCTSRQLYKHGNALPSKTTRPPRAKRKPHPDISNTTSATMEMENLR